MLRSAGAGDADRFRRRPSDQRGWQAAHRAAGRRRVCAEPVSARSKPPRDRVDGDPSRPRQKDEVVVAGRHPGGDIRNFEAHLSAAAPSGDARRRNGSGSDVHAGDVPTFLCQSHGIATGATSQVERAAGNGRCGGKQPPVGDQGIGTVTEIGIVPVELTTPTNVALDSWGSAGSSRHAVIVERLVSERQDQPANGRDTVDPSSRSRCPPAAGTAARRGWAITDRKVSSHG